MAPKRNISIQNMIANPLLEAQAIMGLTTKKNLRRLPHVFTTVLELPFHADAHVSVHESPHCFRFTAETDAVGHVQAHAVQIHPGLTKLVVRDSASLHFALHEFDLDVWRIRLPDSTCPELATAALNTGRLVVTVPKREQVWEDNDENSGMETAAATLLLVQ